MARSLPLALRVPNPPPVFVGRAAEIERLAELLKRAPVAVVHGPDTVGKLAFVLHVLHKKFRARVDRTLYVRVAEGGDARADSEAVESSAARVLARVHEIAQLPPDEHAEIALDLAESASAWVVVDGADDPAWTFAQLAARYARAARWIFIGRHAPPVELVEQAIAIGPLAEAELAELAAAWHPDLDPRERALAAAAAHGSPWQLRRVLAERIARGPDALIVADGVGGVSGAGERVIELLALVREPVPVELLDTRAEVVDGLVARGLVRANDGRVELHPAARALRDGAARDGAARTASDAAARDAAARDAAARDGAARTASDAAARDAAARDAAARDGAARDAAARTAREDAARADLDFAARLAATHEPGLVADAVSIAIKTGRHDLVRAWLDVDGARIISAGYGARIGRVLLTSADLGSWPLRFAVDLGDGDRLRALAPIVLTSADRATWAEGLYRAGATDEGLVAAREAGERLLVARILANRGDTADALEALANPATPAELASAARIAALANRADLAREYLARIGDHAHVLDRAEGAGAQPIDLLVTIASAYHELGDLDATEARLDVIDARLAGDPLARFNGT